MCAPFVKDVLKDLYRQARMHIKKDAYLTPMGVRQGDIGSRSLPTKLRRCFSRVERAAG